MARYNVEHNGKWACFSSIPEGFISDFMDKDAYEEWRKQEYGPTDHTLAEECNRMTIEDAALYISMNRTRKYAFECLLECGLPKPECMRLMAHVNKEKRKEQDDTTT